MNQSFLNFNKSLQMPGKCETLFIRRQFIFKESWLLFSEKISQWKKGWPKERCRLSDVIFWNPSREKHSLLNAEIEHTLSSTCNRPNDHPTKPRLTKRKFIALYSLTIYCLPEASPHLYSAYFCGTRTHWICSLAIKRDFQEIDRNTAPQGGSFRLNYFSILRPSWTTRPKLN